MYLKNLIEKTQHLKLSKQRYWNLLLHYRSRDEGRESAIDDPRFFLSQNGKTDPEAEIEATLSAFFDEPVEEKEHMRCRFVARYAWLKKELKIDEARLPLVTCTDFEQMISDIKPRSAALIFPLAYISSPASMFGHTFLRIGGDTESTLLSTAVNYAARTEKHMGISYLWKGISGGFKGYYYSRPYHEKIKEYTAIEHRDIWEYSLDLTEEEVRRIALHVWEMRDIHSAYYFFDENCSFAMLYLLEVARPSLQLIEQTNRFFVIPISTIRTIIDAGIVTQITYRPSQGTNIRNIAEMLSQEEQYFAHNIATGKIDLNTRSSTSMPMPEKAWLPTLDLAAEYVRYLASRRRINSKEYLKRFHQIMAEKSKQKQTSEDLFEDSYPTPPNQGHLPGRIGIGGGCRSDSCFSEINLRLGYHDLLDHDDGHPKHTQINFMQGIIRYDFDEHQVELYRIQILDIISLEPQNIFFSPLAWKAKIGLEQKLFSGEETGLATNLTLGAGLSRSTRIGIIYTLAEVELNISTYFDDNAAFSIGASAGILASLSPQWKLHASLRSISPLLGDPYRTLRGEVAQNFVMSKNTSVSATISREKTKHHAYSEAKLMWNIYF